MKKGLFIIIIGVLFIPLIQFKFVLFEEKELNGVFDKEEKPEVNWLSWREGVLQKSYNLYFNDHIGFRPFFIKTYNQFRFSVFNSINKVTGTLGDNNIIYDTRYINSSLGKDFVGSVDIKRKVNDIKFVKEKMELEGKRLLIVFAPNKARYFSKEIQGYLRKKDTSNYEIYINEFKKQRIDYIDFNEKFIQLKSRYRCNLIPLYGTHWSNFGSIMAEQSIINYCNDKYNYKLSKYILDSVAVNNYPELGEYDLGDNLNLWVTLDEEKYTYPYLRVKKGTTRERKKLLVISDSFFDSMFRTPFSSEIFNLKGYWYYNKKVKFTNEKTRDKKDEDLSENLRKTDLVIIMLTEFNLNRFGFGIVEELMAYYHGETVLSPEIIHYLIRIRDEEVWYEQIKQTAKEEGISDYNMLLRNAKWMARKK